MTSMPLRWAQISNCSTAAARKVSAAQSITLRPSWRSLFASFPMLVVLPAPLTPTMKITRVPAPFCEAEIPLVVARSGFTGAFKMRMMCDLISRLSCAESASALRSIFSRTASRISRVGFTPKSAESSAVSRSFRIEGSILRSPRKIVSTVSDSAALVLLTELFNRSRSVGSGSFFPKSEIIRLRASHSGQLKIVTDAASPARTRQAMAGGLPLDVHFDGTEAELAGVDCGFESGHHDSIEFCTGQCSDAGHGIESVGHADDARHERNLRALQSVRIASAVHVLMMQFDARKHFLQLRNRAHDVRAFHGVLLH